MQIYLLTDQLEDSIFCYVGKTKKPVGARQYEHWSNASANIVKKNWIKMTKAKEVGLNIKTLWPVDEKAQIANYKNSDDFICLNSASDLKNSQKYYHFNKMDIKNANYIKEPWQTISLIRRREQKINAFLTKNVALNAEKLGQYKNLIDRIIFPYEESLTIVDLIENINPPTEKYFFTMLRDAMLFDSASKNMFYYDVYTKNIVENEGNSLWDVENDFQFLSQFQDINFREIYIYLDIEKKSHVWNKIYPYYQKTMSKNSQSKNNFSL